MERRLFYVKNEIIDYLVLKFMDSKKRNRSVNLTDNDLASVADRTWAHARSKTIKEITDGIISIISRYSDTE